MDRNLVISTDEVHLRENCLSGEFGGKVVDSRHWVSIKLSGFIQSSEIAARSPSPPGFGSDMKG